MFPRVETVPCLTTEQMIAVDRAMVEDLHIDVMQMMENAGRNLAHLARVRFLHGAPAGKHVVVLAGSGGNVTLTVDGIIGYRLSGAPRGAAAEAIEWANTQAAPVLALDAPSGLDATTGAVHSPAVRAAATMTLALPKTGLRAPAAAAHVGELYLADIGVPPGLYKQLLAVAVGPLFARDEIVRLR